MIEPVRNFTTEIERAWKPLPNRNRHEALMYTPDFLPENKPLHSDEALTLKLLPARPILAGILV